MKVQRAAEATIWAMPAVSVYDIEISIQRDLGGKFGDVVYFSKPMASRHGFLTANDVTPYVVSAQSTKAGPLAVEVPPASDMVSCFGTFVDAWQTPIADVGPPGDDKDTGDQKYICSDRKWWNPFVGGNYTFDPNGYLGYDAQAYFAAYATGVTPATATKTVGVGSQYPCTHTDGTGTPLDGAKTYRLHVTPTVPDRRFWSFIVYDSGSRSMMATSQRFPAISSYDKFETNADGSVDLYIGPKAPRGKERNWIETNPAKGWSGIFRIYGPEQAFFDQTWKLSDLERID